MPPAGEMILGRDDGTVVAVDEGTVENTALALALKVGVA